MLQLVNKEWTVEMEGKVWALFFFYGNSKRKECLGNMFFKKICFLSEKTRWIQPPKMEGFFEIQAEMVKTNKMTALALLVWKGIFRYVMLFPNRIKFLYIYFVYIIIVYIQICYSYTELNKIIWILRFLVIAEI